MDAKKPISRAGRPSAEEAQKKKAALLTVAMEEFANVGFEAASLRDIARKADISSRTLYNYFADKVALFDACISQSGQLMILDIGEYQGTLLERLTHHTQVVMAQLAKPDSIKTARIIYRESGRFPELTAIFKRQFEQNQINPVADLLVEAGFDAENSRKFAAHYVAMAFGEWQRRVLFGGATLTDTEIAAQSQQASEIFVKGIGANQDQDFCGCRP
ncbi:TetR/AcrR family transcriptional regulator [Sphingopyxis yananensis]|uniref:TetR/AcrR family transcriptional regulator n=1 Tax=Sphingopyxis yananensis TaxID=2886687 RepID=UPI001D128B89|nr:TetR/AcrR family transcriptional regulator [Sphingopyxis yananensis]MCC2603149.1 TetR/AcrR family transcriptional regulator [Sphingopyxis yananensis]